MFLTPYLTFKPHVHDNCRYPQHRDLVCDKRHIERKRQYNSFIIQAFKLSDETFNLSQERLREEERLKELEEQNRREQERRRLEDEEKYKDAEKILEVKSSCTCILFHMCSVSSFF